MQNPDWWEADMDFSCSGNTSHKAILSPKEGLATLSP